MSFLISIICAFAVETAPQIEAAEHVASSIKTPANKDFVDCQFHFDDQGNAATPSLTPVRNYADWWVQDIRYNLNSTPLPIQKDLIWEQNCDYKTLAVLLMKPEYYSVSSAAVPTAYTVTFPSRIQLDFPSQRQLRIANGWVQADFKEAFQVVCESSLLKPIKKNVVTSVDVQCIEQTTKQQDCIVVEAEPDYEALRLPQSFSFLSALKVDDSPLVIRGTRCSIKRIFGDMPFKNVGSIHFSNNRLVSLKSFKPFKQVTFLDFSHNEIEDISDLKEMSSLNVLLLNNNKIANVSPLDCAKTLKNLNISGNLLTDTASLAQFKKLNFLTIRLLTSQERETLKKELPQCHIEEMM